MGQREMDGIDYCTEFSDRAERGDVTRYTEDEPIPLPDSLHHRHQETLFGLLWNDLDTGAYLRQRLYERRSESLTDEEIDVIVAAEGRPASAEKWDEETHARVERAFFDEISFHDELARLKASYEMRRGNSGEASRFAGMISGFEPKLDLFQEAARLGEWDVVAEFWSLRQEAEQAETVMPLIKYHCAELRLGWNVNVNADAVGVLLGDRSVANYLRDELKNEVVEALLASGDGVAIEQASEQRDRGDEWVTLLKIARAQLALQAPGKSMKRALRQARRNRLLAPWDSADSRDVEALITEDILAPNTRAADTIRRYLNRIWSVSNSAQCDYLEQQYAKDLLALQGGSRDVQEYQEKAEQPGFQAMMMAINRGDLTYAEELYKKCIVSGADSLELLKMSMELSLHDAELSEREGNELSLVQARIELAEADYQLASDTAMVDKIDQSRVRQEHNLALAKLLEQVRHLGDPAERFTALFPLLRLQLMNDPEAPKAQVMQKMFTQVAQQCLRSPIVLLSITAKQIQDACRSLDIELVE